jgi:hypothetical protein
MPFLRTRMLMTCHARHTIDESTCNYNSNFTQGILGPVQCSSRCALTVKYSSPVWGCQSKPTLLRMPAGSNTGRQANILSCQIICSRCSHTFPPPSTSKKLATTAAVQVLQPPQMPRSSKQQHHTSCSTASLLWKGNCRKQRNLHV